MSSKSGRMMSLVTTSISSFFWRLWTRDKAYNICLVMAGRVGKRVMTYSMPQSLRGLALFGVGRGDGRRCQRSRGMVSR